jgi:hypothetical protein
MAITHRQSKTRLHNIWVKMRARCQNPNNDSFRFYGARGVTVCDRWNKFELFRSDVGDPPSDKHTLDRIKATGNYEPGNVRWATAAEQSRNCRRTIYAEIDGERMCLKDAAAARGFKYATVRDRIQRHGWTVDQALNTPVIPKSGLSRDNSQRFAPSPKAKWFGDAFPTRN